MAMMCDKGERRLVDGQTSGEHALDRRAIDRLTLAPRGISQCVVRYAVDVAQRAGRVFMHQGDRVGREEALLRACER